MVRERGGVWDVLEVGPQFFETMGIAVIRGRTLTPADFARDSIDIYHHGEAKTDAEYVRWIGPLVINETFAKHYFPNADPLAGGSQVIGIVKDAKLFSVKDDVRPLMFVPSRIADRFYAVQVRAAGDPVVIGRAIREAVQAVNPLLLSEMTTLGEISARSIAKERMVATISGFFSLLGLVLAAIGVFGIASSAVAQRMKELGIRRALGAGQWVLVRESLRETLIVFGLGLGAGALAAFVAVRLASSLVADLLFGLTATDAANLLAAVGVMVVVALAACSLPALRASRVDPLTCIRED